MTRKTYQRLINVFMTLKVFQGQFFKCQGQFNLYEQICHDLAISNEKTHSNFIIKTKRNKIHLDLWTPNQQVPGAPPSWTIYAWSSNNVGKKSLMVQKKKFLSVDKHMDGQTDMVKPVYAPPPLQLCWRRVYIVYVVHVYTGVAYFCQYDKSTIFF